MNFLNGITLLLIFQLLGELTVQLFQWPVPGPVIGMVYLLIAIALRKAPHPAMETVSLGLLNHLSLLFIPAGVGMILYIPLLKTDGWAIALTLILSTLITLITTAWVMQWLLRFFEPPADGK